MGDEELPERARRDFAVAIGIRKAGILAQVKCLWESRCEDCVCFLPGGHDTLVQYAACLLLLPSGGADGA